MESESLEFEKGLVLASSCESFCVHKFLSFGVPFLVGFFFFDPIFCELSYHIFRHKKEASFVLFHICGPLSFSHVSKPPSPSHHLCGLDFHSLFLSHSFSFDPFGLLPSCFDPYL